MFLKKMKILSFIKEKIKIKKNKTEPKTKEIEDKKLWLEGEGPQTD